LLDRLRYYVNGQAGSISHYVSQGLILSLFSRLPGLPGIAARTFAYRLIMKLDGYAAIEANARLRCTHNIRLGRNVFLDRGVYLHACPAGIEIGADTFIMHHAELHVFNFRDLPHAFIKIGRRCFVGEFTLIRGQGGVVIGDAVLIAPGVQILAVNHNYGLIGIPIMDQGITAKGITIKDGAWLGGGAVILDGVTIGEGAVIGANAVVTKDVPAHSVVVGSPARVIKRYDHGALSQALLREVGIPGCFGGKVSAPEY